jgi:N-acetylneuraminic acid mutarotase
MRIDKWDTEFRYFEIPKGPIIALRVFDNCYIFNSENGHDKSNITTHTLASKLDDDEVPTKWELVPKNVPPTTLVGGSVITIGGRIYILGGYEKDMVSSSIYYAPIKKDKTVGMWRRTGTLPFAISGASSIVLNNELILVGGIDEAGVVTSAIFKATITEDDKLTDWTFCGEISVPLSDSQLIKLDKRLYLVGGHNGVAPVQNVYKITIENGVADVDEYTPLPIPLHSFTYAKLGNKLYIVGGVGKRGTSRTVLVSVIFDNNDISEWEFDTDLPFEVDNIKAINSKDSFYLLGGETSVEGKRLIFKPSFSVEKDKLVVKRGQIKASGKRSLFVNNVIIVLLVLMIILFLYNVERVVPTSSLDVINIVPKK